jgi:uncharacterized MnhB-related membrane protein
MTTFALCVCLIMLVTCGIAVALKVEPNQLDAITSFGVLSLLVVIIISFIKVVDLLGKVQKCGLD